MNASRGLIFVRLSRATNMLFYVVNYNGDNFEVEIYNVDVFHIDEKRFRTVAKLL